MNRSKIKTGVYVCRCGTNIAATVDVESVADYAGTLPGVVLAREYTYMCSDPGQELIKEDIQEHGLNRVVVASCSPLMHEPTFRGACAEAPPVVPIIHSRMPVLMLCRYPFMIVQLTSWSFSLPHTPASSQVLKHA